MHKELGAEFYAATTRKPAIYRGNPFQIEVGLAWGGKLDAEGVARVIRFANRVPLQYQLSACSSTKAVMDVAWKSYGLQQSKGSLPVGPLVIMVHMASVWVPFTNQAKEAIADYDEIRKEFKLALQEAGRKLGPTSSTSRRRRARPSAATSSTPTSRRWCAPTRASPRKTAPPCARRCWKRRGRRRNSRRSWRP
jgi:DNA topoisomerase VI B subunit